MIFKLKPTTVAFSGMSGKKLSLLEDELGIELVKRSINDLVSSDFIKANESFKFEVGKKLVYSTK